MLWFAVADGLGSAQYSHVGSDAAVRLVGSLIGELSPTEDPIAPETGLKIAKSISRALQGQADSFGIPPKTLATTLQFVLVDTNSGEFSYNAIGDGHCVLRTSQGSSCILGLGRIQTEYGAPHILMSDWETYFHHEAGVLDHDALILAFTDGLDPLFLTPRTEQTPHKTVSAQSVDAFYNLFSESYNENKAIFAASQTIDHEKYVDRIRDDVSFLALKWKSQPNTPPRISPKLGEGHSNFEKRVTESPKPAIDSAPPPPSQEGRELKDGSLTEADDKNSLDEGLHTLQPPVGEQRKKRWPNFFRRHKPSAPNGFINAMAKKVAVGAFLAVLALLFALSSRMITVQFGGGPSAQSSTSYTMPSHQNDLTPNASGSPEGEIEVIQPITPSSSPTLPLLPNEATVTETPPSNTPIDNRAIDPSSTTGVEIDAGG